MSSPSPSCANADFTQFPTNDTACAVVSTVSLPSNTSSALDSCCKTASVEQWNGDCGYYCLSVQQTVAQLQACFQEKGVRPQDIMCNSNQTATATASPTGGQGASRTGGAGGASPSTGGAAGVVVPGGLGKAGAGAMVMLVVAVFAGGML